MGREAGSPATAAEIVEQALIHHGASAALIHAILGRRGRHRRPVDLLASGFRATLNFAPLPATQGARIILLGTPAAGKTTMLAKLAARHTKPLPAVFTTDFERPGGYHQLAEFLAVLGIEVHPIDASVAHGAGVISSPGPLLIDTCGMDASDGAGFAALGSLVAAGSAEPILVLSALADAEEARDLADAAQSVGAKRLLVSRLDMARRMGAVLAACEAGLALAGGSLTPHFSYGLKRLGASTLAQRLIGEFPRPFTP